MHRRLITFVVLVVAALVVAGFSTGATASETYKLSATLKARNETPKPVGTRHGAKGTFKGTLKNGKLTFTLTFKRLTGAAMQAHIHKGKPGVAGPVLLALCGPCKSPVRATLPVNEDTEKAIESGKAYVNVHTAKNAGGEIRGQIRSKEK